MKIERVNYLQEMSLEEFLDQYGYSVTIEQESPTCFRAVVSIKSPSNADVFAIGDTENDALDSLRQKLLYHAVVKCGDFGEVRVPSMTKVWRDK